MMKPKNNYFYVNRSLLQSDRWLEEPFTRGQAWVDMFGLANHKDGYIRVSGYKVIVQRGQLGWSQRALCTRWKWSRGKLIRFLNELAENGDIKICGYIGEKSNNSKKSEKTVPQTVPQTAHLAKSKINLITILKYDFWQGNKIENEQENEKNSTTDSTTDSTITRRIKKNKEIYKENSELKKEIAKERKQLRGIEKSLKDNLPLEEIKKIALKYHVKEDLVAEYKEAYTLWIQEKPRDPKRHDRDMRASVQGWIRRDLSAKKIKPQKSWIEQVREELNGELY